MAQRLEAMGNARYKSGFDFTMHFDKIDEPLSWRKPRRVFVNSMSDLFHEEASHDFLRQVFEVMMQTPKHQYQVLTKRPGRMAGVLRELRADGVYEPSPHIWLGTSVEDARVADRIEALREVPAAVRFLSCEPLIGPIPDLNLTGIHWVIVGGESGTHLWKDRTRRRRSLVARQDGSWVPREDRADWVREIRDVCVENDVSFFFKQWGGNTPKAGGRILDGRTWEEFPI
jgi:protein gp37